MVTHEKDREEITSEQIQIEVIINKLLGDLDSDVLLLCHKNADPDALGSAYALEKFLNIQDSFLNI